MKCALLAALLVVAAFVIAQTARAGFVQPVFDPANFTPGAPIDNKFFPLVPGTTFTTQANTSDPDTGETGFEVDKDFVTFTTKNIGGVQARVVHATVFLDGRLVEDTNDYYAQDQSGNVWYLGEDTKAFELDDQGHIISTDTTGSWRTGVHGALPGFIMPANPTVGFQYIQENAPQDEAQDQAEIVSLNESLTVPVGSFTNVLKTLESTPLEPGVFENKFYAAGVGPIMVFEDLKSDGTPLNRIPLVSVTHASAIPLPAALMPGSACLLVMLGASALKRQHRATST
jgi:hypothetical protein